MLTIECQVTKSRHSCNRVWVITVKGLSIECEVTKSKQALHQSGVPWCMVVTIQYIEAVTQGQPFE